MTLRGKAEALRSVRAVGRALAVWEGVAAARLMAEVGARGRAAAGEGKHEKAAVAALMRAPRPVEAAPVARVRVAMVEGRAGEGHVRIVMGAQGRARVAKAVVRVKVAMVAVHMRMTMAVARRLTAPEACVHSVVRAGAAAVAAWPLMVVGAVAAWPVLVMGALRAEEEAAGRAVTEQTGAARVVMKGRARGPWEWALARPQAAGRIEAVQMARW